MSEKTPTANTHGGARKGAGRKATGRKKEFKTLSISGTPEEIQDIKKAAEKSGKTTSRFIIDLALQKK